MTDGNRSAPSSPLWAAEGTTVDAHIVAFCAGEDAVLDPLLLEDDLICTRAHVRGLGRIGILDDGEVALLVDALGVLIDEYRAGAFTMSPQDEDGHSAIERTLVERLGDAGKKVHTGRSRNDQVLVATRHFLRRKLDAIAGDLFDAAEVALSRAEVSASVLLPGYTHLQRAVPSTVGFWFAGHAESLLVDAQAVLDARRLLDGCPLGTAAGYGVNLPLDRDGVAKELGFGHVELNGLAAQNGRGRLEAHVVSALLTAMGTVRRLAWDLSLFTTGEYAFVRLPSRWTTGSSIMPNKRNPDVVELLRASFSTVAAAHAELLHATALPSGYQRDLQLTKGPAMRAVATSARSVALLKELLVDVEFDATRTEAAMERAMLATDRAVELAVAGVPFRDAYRQVKAELEAGEGDLVESCRESIRARVSPGAPGALGLETLKARLVAARASR